MQMRVAFIACVLGLASFAVAQQQPPQQPEFGESIEVSLHSLDAVVTDRDGKPVTGLTRNDFVLRENGVLKEITNFSAYDDRSMSIATPSSPDAAVADAPTAAPPRRFVFFIDEMSIQAAARNKLKKHALEMVRGMRPGDVATVVRPTGTTKILQDYTDNREEVEKSLGKAIDSCKVRLTTPAFIELQALRRALQSANTPNEISAAKREYVERATDRVEQRLGQLRALVASMSGAEGKKVLVIITSGLSAKPGEEVFSLDEQLGIFERDMKKPDPQEAELAIQQAEEKEHSRKPLLKWAMREDVTMWDRDAGWLGMHRGHGNNFGEMIDNLARTAAAEGVTIYALEPEVPLFLDMTKSAESSTMGSTLVSLNVQGRTVIPPEMITQLLHHEAQTLTSMADKTGGRWFRGVGAIDETFLQMYNDLSVYYSLAYRVSGDASKPRKLELAVRNRPDLKVRTRSETIDRSRARGMADRVVAELVYPGDTNDLQMSVSTEKPQKDGKMFLVPVEVVIPAEKMTFVRSSAGTYTAHVSLHYATAIEKKEFVSYGRQEQIVELSPQQYAQQKKIRYRYQSSIPVPKGNVRIALGVTDTTSSLSSLQTVAVKAP
jgi:VWFA-related protein